MATRDLPLTFLPPASPHRTSILPPDLSLLLLDTLASPGIFALVHFIGRALRGSTEGPTRGSGKRPVVLVGLAEGEAGWEGLLKKQGIQVASERTRGFFAFVDARDTLERPADSTSAPSLDGLSSAIDAAVGRLDSTSPPLIVVDDLASLLWTGYSLSDVRRLHALLRALQRKTRASLLLTFHADLTTSSNSCAAVEDADQSLLSSLLHLSDVIVRTKSLGRFDTGEYSVSRGPAYLDDPELPVTRDGITIQYRLSDTSVSYVTKGLNRDFL